MGNENTVKKAEKPVSNSTKDFLKTIGGLGGSTKRLTSLPIDQIDPDEDQPRGSLHGLDGQLPEDVQVAIAELAASIEAIGLQQPIKVREASGGRYTIIMGERRWRATRLNRDRGVPNSDHIDCIIERGMEAEKLVMAQLSENLNREDLTDLEVAHYLKKKMDENPELMKKNIAELIRRPPSYISRILGLLDPKYADLVGNGLITYASLLEQYKALSEAEQARLAEEATASKRPITSGDVKAARERTKKAKEADQKAPPAGTDVVAGAAAELAKQRLEGETYTPSAHVVEAAAAKKAPSSGSESPMQYRDTGADLVVPNEPETNPDTVAKAKVTLTIAQLEKLLSQAEIGDKTLAITMYMPMAELETVLTSLGCRVPKEKTVWPITLAERLND